QVRVQVQSPCSGLWTRTRCSALALLSFADDHLGRGHQETQLIAALRFPSGRGDGASKTGLQLGRPESLERFGGHTDLNWRWILGLDAEELVLVQLFVQVLPHEVVDRPRLDRGFGE